MLDPGSVRAIVNASGTVTERNDYHPYGARHSNSSLTKTDGNRWRFSGKEEFDDAFGLPQSDFGARFYDRTSWTTIDPLAEKYYNVSTYTFCKNNPIIYIDPTGAWDIKVSASDDRGRYPYAIMSATNRHGEIIYQTIVKVRGTHRRRDATNGDTPIGEYRIIEWRETGNKNYSVEKFGQYPLLALEYIGEEGKGRFGMHLHGGALNKYNELKGTEGCIRILDEDMKELYDTIKSLEGSDPLETKGFVNVANDLPAPVKYRDREYIKDNWERNLGELDPAILTSYK